MLTKRSAKDRGHANHGWLDTNHTFSFADYHDPAQMGFGPLRVINEDRIVGGAGFPTHGHRDMEIVSYVLEGAIEHKDSMGTGSVIRPGDVQRMSAGTGVKHSEYNASKSEAAHFMQIWIVPAKPGGAPGYEQKRFEDAEKRGRLRLVASPDGSEGSVTIAQDVRLYATRPEGETLTHALGGQRKAWVQVARGTATVNGLDLVAGDGVAIEKEVNVTIKGTQGSELLLFDLPA